MNTVITYTLSFGTILSHIAIVFFVAVLAIRSSVADKFITWVGERAVLFSFLVVLTAVVGSLLYSNVIGFPPCELCIWQRIFLYPQLITFALALWWREKNILKYNIVLTLVGGIIALYHSFSQVTGLSVLPCTAEGAACSKLYVLAFGYITIPVMALTTFLLLGMLYIFSRKTTRITSLM